MTEPTPVAEQTRQAILQAIYGNVEDKKAAYENSLRRCASSSLRALAPWGTHVSVVSAGLGPDRGIGQVQVVDRVCGPQS